MYELTNSKGVVATTTPFYIINKLSLKADVCYTLVLINGKKIKLGTYQKESVNGGIVTCIYRATIKNHMIIIQKNLIYPNERLTKYENINLSFLKGIVDENGDYYCIKNNQDF